MIFGALACRAKCFAFLDERVVAACGPWALGQIVHNPH
jgi:hypothetical protein